MAAEPVVTEEKKTNGKGNLTKADFIRSLPSDVPTESVIEQGAKVGLEISTSQVRQVRSAMRTGKKSKKRKAKKSKAELDAIRKEAGRKAAETKARRSGKPPKSKGRARPRKKAPLFSPLDGAMKTPVLLKKIDQEAERAFIEGVIQLGTRKCREILDTIETTVAQGL